MAEAKLLAEREVGKILASRELHGGKRNRADSPERAILEEFGITRNQSSNWQREASLPDELFQQYLDQSRLAGKEVSSAELLRRARTYHRKSKPQAGADPFLRRVAETLRSLAAQGKRFSCIYADYCWDAGRKPRSRQYPIAQSLAKLPVQDVTASDAHLHLWVPPERLLAGLEVLKRWGFRYETSLAWGTCSAAYGNYWTTAHGILLLGVRGRLVFHDTGLMSFVDGQGRSPGDRPLAIRKLLERASPPPCLDLFGIRDSSGWTVVAQEFANIVDLGPTKRHTS